MNIRFSRRKTWFVSIVLVLCSGLAVVRLNEFLRPPGRMFPFTGFHTNSSHLQVEQYFEDGLYDQAIEHLTATIQSNPGNAPAYFYRGLAHTYKREPDRALEDFKEAMRLDPTNPEYYAGRGICYHTQGEFDLAIKDLTRAINEGTAAPIFQTFRGEVYASKGEYEQAIADYGRAIRANPQNARALEDRALAYLNQNEMDKALSDVNQAIRIRPSRAEYYSTRGYVYKKMRRYRDALGDYRECIRRDPKHELTYTRFGWILATCPDATVRDANEGLKYATRACELGFWRDAYSLDSLAAAYAEAGQFDDAVKWQKRALELESPQFPKEELDKARLRLQLYEQHQPFREES